MISEFFFGVLFFQKFSIVSMGVYAFFTTSLFGCFISKLCFVARGNE